MKNILKLTLGIVLLFSMTSMSNIKEKKEKSKTIESIRASSPQVPCSNVYTICDKIFPNSYELFDACMRVNGC